MMNLLHGDVERLGWLDPSTYDDDFPVRRVKPLTEVYEEEVALYAYLSKIPFQSASCPYMHEALRSEVRDYLNELESKHPGMKNVLLASALDVTSRLSKDARGGDEVLGQGDRALREVREALLEGRVRGLQDDRDSVAAH